MIRTLMEANTPKDVLYGDHIVRNVTVIDDPYNTEFLILFDMAKGSKKSMTENELEENLKRQFKSEYNNELDMIGVERIHRADTWENPLVDGINYHDYIICKYRYKGKEKEFPVETEISKPIYAQLEHSINVATGVRYEVLEGVKA